MAMVLVEGGDQLPALVGQYNGTANGSGAATLIGDNYCRAAVIAAIAVGFITLWY
ncbi:hypothetical protein AUP68_11060 [Ilyonectria robusta]